MFADPQTITAITGITSLPRTGAGPTNGTFSSPDGTVLMNVSHANGKRSRMSARLTQSKVSADPLIPSQNLRASASAFLVVDAPLNGFTTAELKILTDTLVAWLAASTGAKVTQLLGGEN